MDDLDFGTIVNGDGTFTDDWRDQVFPGEENADIRDNKTLSNIKDIRTLSRQVISGESQIGKLTGGRAFAILPNEHSTAEEVAEYRTKIGWPKESTEYGLQEMDGADKKFAAHMEKTLHDAGAPKGVAEAVAKGYMAYAKEAEEAQATEDKIADAKEDKKIRDTFGSTYDAQIANANLAIDALAAPINAEFAAQLKKDIPFDSNAAQLFAKIGAMIAEDPGLQHQTGSAGFTPKDALDKANEIMSNNPYYITPSPAGKPYNMEAHKKALEEVQNLFNIAYPK